MKKQISLIINVIRKLVIFILLLVQFSTPSYSSTPNSFECGCVEGRDGDVNRCFVETDWCNPGFNAYDELCMSHENSRYFGNVWEMACIESVEYVQHGEICDPNNKAQICQTSEATTPRSMSCKQTQIGAQTYKCLKNNLNEGSLCIDHSECLTNFCVTMSDDPGRSTCQYLSPELECEVSEDDTISCTSIKPIQPNIAFDLCRQAGGGDLEKQCCECAYRDEVCPDNPSEVEVKGLWTSVGCIPVSTTASGGGMVGGLFRVGLGLAGGFALVFILFGAFTVSTSVGNPEKVKSGQEMITAAIFGLLFIIFSSLILRFIGVSILQIPGF